MFFFNSSPLDSTQPMFTHMFLSPAIYFLLTMHRSKVVRLSDSLITTNKLRIGASFGVHIYASECMHISMNICGVLVYLFSPGPIAQLFYVYWQMQCGETHWIPICPYIVRYLGKYTWVCQVNDLSRLLLALSCVCFYHWHKLINIFLYSKRCRLGHLFAVHFCRRQVTVWSTYIKQAITETKLRTKPSKAVRRTESCS